MGAGAPLEGCEVGRVGMEGMGVNKGPEVEGLHLVGLRMRQVVEGRAEEVKG